MDLAQRIQDDLDDIYPANTATPNPGPPESIPLEIFLDMAVEENDESSGASGSDVSDDEDESIEV